MNVLAQLLGQVHLVLSLLYMLAVEFLDIIAVEHSLARFDRPQKRLDLVEQLLLEHSGMDGRFVRVFLKDVPAGEDQVFEAGQRDELADLGRPALGALTQPAARYRYARLQRRP